MVEHTELYHLSLNSSQPTTLLLLHGLSSSHLEFTPLLPHLTHYHLLLPDLPAHSRSSHITPFTLPHSASLVASLIYTHAHNQKCHLVGVSAGGFVAVEIAARYPELVQSLFVSGVYDLNAKWGWLLNIAPYTNIIEGLVPATVISFIHRRMGLNFPSGLWEEMVANAKFAMLKVAWKSLSEFGGEKEVCVRTLAVAGGRQDDVEGVRRLGRVFRKGNEKSRGSVVEMALHSWDLQMPELFVEGVVKWIEEKELPSAFKILD
jgi:pimeloyl-ACP methyl ester carboxylesterase